MKNGIESFKRIVNQLNYILTSKQKRQALVVVVLMILSAGLELLGVSAIFPFLQLMITQERLKTAWYTTWIYDLFPFASVQQVLIVIGIAIMLIYLLKNGFMIFSIYIQGAYAARIQRELSTFLLDSYLRRPYQFFINTNSSEIYRGITEDIAGIYQILLTIFSMCTELITIFCIGIYLFMTDYELALGAVILAGVCCVVIIAGFKRKMKAAGQRRLKAEGLANKYAFQAINGIKEITVLGRRNNFVEQYNGAAVLRQSAIVVQNFIITCPDRILEGVCIGGFMGIICLRIKEGVDLTEFIPIIGSFAMAAFKILPSIAKVSSRVNTLIFYQGYIQSVYANLKESQLYEEKIREYNNVHAKKIEDNTTTNIAFQNNLKIINISWRYQNACNNVLDNVSLQINKGESVALIGTSGAGKSTLADIIMGLFMPQQGTVEMDGVDIFTISEQWRKIIGYVPQSVFLIDDTVRGNIAFGIEREKISDDKVWKTLEQARLKEFVEKLPYGLDTVVGERGIKFSGGQKQRIAIARALYNEPEILVLDEATAALDNETETAVMESIEALQGQMTLIIVAHRLTTIRNCDSIYEIRDGQAIKRDKKEVLKMNSREDNRG